MQAFSVKNNLFFISWNINCDTEAVCTSLKNIAKIIDKVLTLIFLYDILSLCWNYFFFSLYEIYQTAACILYLYFSILYYTILYYVAFLRQKLTKTIVSEAETPKRSNFWIRNITELKFLNQKLQNNPHISAHFRKKTCGFAQKNIIS